MSLFEHFETATDIQVALFQSQPRQLNYNLSSFFFSRIYIHQKALKPQRLHHSTGRGYTVPIFATIGFSGFTCPAVVYLYFNIHLFKHFLLIKYTCVCGELKCVFVSWLSQYKVNFQWKAPPPPPPLPLQLQAHRPQKDTSTFSLLGHMSPLFVSTPPPPHHLLLQIKNPPVVGQVKSLRSKLVFISSRASNKFISQDK